MQINPQLLLRGDSLIFRASSLMGLWIWFKTWENASHIAIVSDPLKALEVEACEKGVNEFPLRLDKYLRAVLRPTLPFDFDKAYSWFNTPYNKVTHTGIRGQGYDLKGLFVFYLAARHGSPDKMFCSEFATRFYRQGGFNPVSPSCDADRVSPAQYLQSPVFKQVYL